MKSFVHFPQFCSHRRARINVGIIESEATIRFRNLFAKVLGKMNQALQFGSYFPSMWLITKYLVDIFERQCAKSRPAMVRSLVGRGAYGAQMEGSALRLHLRGPYHAGTRVRVLRTQLSSKGQVQGTKSAMLGRGAAMARLSACAFVARQSNLYQGIYAL